MEHDPAGLRVRGGLLFPGHMLSGDPLSGDLLPGDHLPDISDSDDDPLLSDDCTTRRSSAGAEFSDDDFLVDAGEIENNVHVTEDDIAASIANEKHLRSTEVHGASEPWWKKSPAALMAESRKAGWKPVETPAIQGWQDLYASDVPESLATTYLRRRVEKLETQNNWMRRMILELKSQVNALERARKEDSARISEIGGDVNNLSTQVVIGVNTEFARVYGILNDKLDTPIPEEPVFIT